MKFHENLSSGIGVVLCGQTDSWADIMKLRVVFCDFANVPKNMRYLHYAEVGLTKLHASLGAFA
jgi:hypothetical protein